MTSTINITGGNLGQAREALADLLGELGSRSASLTSAGRESWPGPPDLHLVVDELPQLLADVHCRSLFRRALSAGRKLGLTGVAHGNVETGASFGGCPVIRDLLTAGVPLTHTDAGNATSNATVAHR
ncbi:hypothetical protein ACIBCR_15470 [Micromonospora echinospora]|uniref:hypothetical protein n=1 Tax=Micromonospora echinospora TaxID=1877 RepID=UPI0037BA53DF